MDKENRIIEQENKKIDKPNAETDRANTEADTSNALADAPDRETGMPNPGEDRPGREMDSQNTETDRADTGTKASNIEAGIPSTKDTVPKESINTQNRKPRNQHKDIDRPHKGNDRQSSQTGRQAKNADRQGKQASRQQTDANKQHSKDTGDIVRKRKKSPKDRIQKKNQERILHICLLALIALILIVSVVILVRWNKGNKVEIDPNNAQQFDYEDEDYVVYWDQNQKEGYVDDGELSILFLGDDVISDYTADTGIANLVESNIEDAVVYNAAFSNTTMTAANLNFDENYGLDAFSLYWLGKCIELDTFDLLDNSLPNVGGDTSGYQDAIDTLKSVDFNTLDVIVIYYGLNDYLEGRQITHLGVEDDKTAYTGSLYATVTMLQEKYPNLQIIIASPTYCYVDANDDSTGCDTTDTGEGMLADYMVAAKNIAVMLNVSYMDNYYGIGMNLETAADKYLEDNMQHPNAAARKIIADRITEFIQYRIPLESETNEE